MVFRMTVTDLWTMWDELRLKTVVDIYTSDGDILEVNQLFENVHWDEIGNRYKNSEVWMAYPEETSCCSVKKWRVALK